MPDIKRRHILAAPALLALGASPPARGETRNAPGITDTEIKIGQTLPYSGPASAYGQLGRVEAAYFRALNEAGGINGRKITVLSLDDGFSPPKAVEQVRRLIEQERVAFIFNTLGTPINVVIRQYLNQHKIPHLFVAAGSARFADPAHFPWTIGWQPTLMSEAAFYAKNVLEKTPKGRIAVLYQNDDFGKELLAGLKEGLGDKAGMIVSEASYEATDPTVDSQIVTLQGSGADVLFMFTYAKQGAQAIRKTFDIGWHPDKYIHLGAASVAATFVPAGLEKSIGVKTAGFIKDATDPKWAEDADVKAWRAWMTKNLPDADLNDSINVAGYSFAQTLEQVLRQCGNDLSRENIMRQAASLHDFRLPMLLPGSLINTSPTQYRVITYMKLQSFDGKGWAFV
ncbi:MAG: ABC transporter substrate-binding protein [Alphaproteobacteria bacterium]|nr:ABC transporter substrate-binding protein [Alphaproteobacteria bacterium]